MKEKNEKMEKIGTDEKTEKTEQNSEQDKSKNTDYAIARVRESNSGQKVVTVPRYCEKIQSGNYVKIMKVKDDSELKEVDKNDCKDEQ